ncbi:alpha/beta hydrolase [Candidatus Saccharibacteria bacterium]|nr:alpha/beta hydrolase [Candidatus Saccharibacteria bacterium]
MKKAIFIHGFYAKEKYYDPDMPLINFKDYTPWLLKQLTTKDYLVYAPMMPWPYFPVYEDWKRELEKLEPDEDTVLIGQSFGGGFLVRWLSEANRKVGKVYLCAPAYYAWDHEGAGSNYEATFFDFELDKDLARKTAGLTILESTNDDEKIKRSYEFLKVLNNAKTITLENRGHFTISTGGEVNEKFPELLEDILQGEQK